MGCWEAFFRRLNKHCLLLRVEKNSFSLQPVVVLERLPDEVLKWHIESYKYSKWASAELVRDETCYPSWSRYVAKKKSTKSDQSTIPPDKDQSSVVVGSFKLTSLKEGAEEQTLFRTTSMSKNNVRCSKCGALFLKTKSNAMCLNCRPKALAMEKIKKQWKQMSINSCNLPKQRAHMIINQKSEATNLQTSATRIELIKYLKKRKLSEEKHYSDDDKCGFKSLESNVAKRLRDWDSSFAHTNNLTSVNKQNSQTISEDSSGEIFKNFGISPVKRSNGCLHNIKPYILENHSWARDQEGNGTKKCSFFVDEIKETVLKKEGTSTNFQNEKKKMENLDNKSRKEKKDDFCMQALRRTDTDERLKINSSDIQPKHSPSQQKGIRTNKVEWKKHQNDPYLENLNTKKDSLINEEVSYTDDNDCVNSKVNPNSKKVMDADCPQGNRMEVCLQSDNNVKIETQQDKRQSLESFSCKETLSNQNEDAKLNVKIKENNTDEECKSTTKVILNVDRNKITFKQVVGSYKKRGVEIKDVRNGLLLMTFDDDEDIISETEEPLVESHLPKNGICDNFQEGNRNMHSYNDNLQYMEDNEHLKKKHSFLEAEQNTSNQSVNQITKVQLEETQKLQYNQKQKNLKLELEKAQIVGNSTASAPEIKDNHGCLQQISHVRSQKSTSDLKEPKVTQHVTLHDETDEQYGKSSAYSEVMSQLEGAESILGHEMLVPVVQNVNLKKEKSKTLKEEIVNFGKKAWQ
ncbi:uncharacterized protein LOC143253761 isoform X1 [Tachypleus tridentatus]|uniref:uncharacterized protein LOC143253761 isoform X1 n=1 Tax=Tachypleus tridentatus TaxID=6853 RepID=UPI003FD4F741